MTLFLNYIPTGLQSGSHTIDVVVDIDGNDGSLNGSGLELFVVNNKNVSYDWQGVIGNTGPLNGPGGLKGLSPPIKIQIVGNQAVWGVG